MASMDIMAFGRGPRRFTLSRITQRNKVMPRRFAAQLARFILQRLSRTEAMIYNQSMV